MKNPISLFLFFILLSVSFAACTDDEKISTDPNLSLEFSSDTIRIDTIFTELGSATKRLKVYNRSNYALNIASIELMGKGQSGFRINVDGEAGSKAENLRILAKDSMFIFIEVTIDPLNSNSPMLITDSIRFNYNGKNQFVQLEAVGQDAIVWHGKTIENDTTLTGEKPFLIYDSLVINAGATLNLEKNVRLHFQKGAKVLVKGSLNVKGTIEEPVYFRGARYDNILTDVPYNNIPGQWGGIIVDSLSFNNHFENARIRGTEYGIIFNQSDPSQLKATFLNTIVINSQADGISATDCNITAKNSLFSNAKGATVRLIGGYYSFIHCTLANYLSWWGMGHTAGLIIGNVITLDSGSEEVRLLNQCDFFNCIIADSGFKGIQFQNKMNGNEVNASFEHQFRNCLIQIGGKDDPDNFFNNIWNKSPEFVDINSNNNYNYNFELDSISPAINIADVTYSVSLPNDLNGTPRLSDKAPDAGCYEWVKKED